MNTKIRATAVFLFALLLVTSCGSSRKSGNTDNSVKDTVEIKYAKGSTSAAMSITKKSPYTIYPSKDARNRLYIW